MSLIEYLPAIYQDPSDGEELGAAQFLIRFLWAFERILVSGAPLAPPEGETGGSRTDLHAPHGGGVTPSGVAGARVRNDEVGGGSAHSGGEDDRTSQYERAPRPHAGGATTTSEGYAPVRDEEVAGWSAPSGRRDVRTGPYERGPRPHGSAGHRLSALDDQFPAIEDEIAGLFRYFRAAEAPDAFLPWLANWVALALRTDMSLVRQRRLLANAARLYRIRGTRRGLEEVLKLYLDAMPSITDEDQPSLQILDHSHVGVDTFLGGGASFVFEVKLAFAVREERFVSEQLQLAREVLEFERPAHTSYQLVDIYPRMQLGVQSTVGVETILA